MASSQTSVSSVKSCKLVDPVTQLNRQKQCIHPSVVDEAINKIKLEMSTEQFIELLNGSSATQQYIARQAVQQIGSEVRRIFSQEYSVLTVDPVPSTPPPGGSAYQYSQSLSIPSSLSHKHHDPNHNYNNHNHNRHSQQQQPVGSDQKLQKSECHAEQRFLRVQQSEGGDDERPSQSPDHNQRLPDLILDLEPSDDDDNRVMSQDDDDSTVSDEDSVSFALQIDLEANHASVDQQLAEPCPPLSSLLPSVPADVILKNATLSRFITDFLDDASLSHFAVSSKLCHRRCECGALGQYISIDHANWFHAYIRNKISAVRHMKPSTAIVLDFTKFDRQISAAKYRLFVKQTFENMREQRMFQTCETLRIVSPPCFIARRLPLIGRLENIQQLYIGGIEIFPVIVLVGSLIAANNNSNSGLKSLSLVDIDIRKEKYGDLYTQKDEWMRRYLNDEVVDDVVNRFMLRIFECEHVAIAGWRNEHKFWNYTVGEIYNMLDKSLPPSLCDALQNSPMKHLVYLPSHPNEDCIPHSLMKLLLQHKASQMEHIKIKFGDKSSLYKNVVNKLQKNGFAMNNVKHMQFAWSDRVSYKFLDALKDAVDLQSVRLYIPTKRTLCKTELKTINMLKRICANVVVEKRMMPAHE